MKDLSDFIKNELLKKRVFDENNYNSISTIEEAEDVISSIVCGNMHNLVFDNSNIKTFFINKLLTTKPDTSVINCNCSLSRFNESDFDSDLLVFDNILKCKYPEILEKIKKIEGVFIC